VPEAPEYRRLVEQLLADPEVGETKMMGMPSLKVATKLFGGLSDGRLVVKIGRDRARELIDAGRAEPFDPSKRGRPMTDWAMLGEPTDGWSSRPRRRGSSPAVELRLGQPPLGYGLASRIMLNGVSVARRTRVKPPCLMTSASRASPAWAPSARPTSCASDAGVQTTVDAP
jgi:TfoX/Sxy family transcriptional regulator of competence genes